MMAKKGRKSKKDSLRDLSIISIKANFDTTSPNATIAKLTQDGAKLTLEVPEDQVEALMDLVKKGKGKVLNIYIDIDNILGNSLDTLIAEKLTFLENFLKELNVEEFRNQLKNICANDKHIDVDKLTDLQIKALSLLCIYDANTTITDSDVAFILKIPLATIKIWQTDLNFKRCKSALNEFNLQCARGEILQIAWRNAKKNADGQAMKNIMNFLGMFKSVPVISQNFTFLGDAKEKTESEVNRLFSDLFKEQ